MWPLKNVDVMVKDRICFARKNSTKILGQVKYIRDSCTMFARQIRKQRFQSYPAFYSSFPLPQISLRAAASMVQSRNQEIAAWEQQQQQQKQQQQQQEEQDCQQEQQRQEQERQQERQEQQRQEQTQQSEQGQPPEQDQAEQQQQSGDPQPDQRREQTQAPEQEQQRPEQEQQQQPSEQQQQQQEQQPVSPLTAPSEQQQQQQQHESVPPHTAPPLSVTIPSPAPIPTPAAEFVAYRARPYRRDAFISDAGSSGRYGQRWFEVRPWSYARRGQSRDTTNSAKCTISMHDSIFSTRTRIKLFSSRVSAMILTMSSRKNAENIVYTPIYVCIFDSLPSDPSVPAVCATCGRRLFLGTHPDAFRTMAIITVVILLVLVVLQAATATAAASLLHFRQRRHRADECVDECRRVAETPHTGVWPL